MNIKELPKALEAEREILGIVLNNNKYMNKIVNELDPEDFYIAAHKEIYKTYLKLYSEGIDITIVTIIETVGKANVDKIGSISYLTELISYSIYSVVDVLIKIIKEKSYRRKAIEKTSKALTDLYNEEIDSKKIIGKLQEEILEKSKTAIADDRELFLETLEDIEERYQTGGEIPGMKTGYTKFDMVTNGFKAGELVVIAGRPSMGKTLLALNIIDGLAQNGNKSGLIELEMTRKQLGKRRLAYNSLVEAQKLQTGKLTTDEFMRIANEANKLSKNNMVLTDCSDYQDILTIKAKAKAMKTAHDIKILLVDHIGLMNIVDNGNRAYAIGEVTRQFKLLAKELNITVIVLSQLSRAVEQRADKRPMLSDLRESGSIEQDADLVMFVYRDEYYYKDSEDKGIMECIIAKQRDGKTGTINLSYIDKYQKIGNLEV